MKKLLSLFLVFCLAFGAVSALAEDEPTVVNWSDYEDQAADVEGRFAEISDIGLKMFIPDVFRDTEISEETAANGTFLVLQTEDGGAVVSAQAISMEIDQFRTTLEGNGHSTWETVVNGIHFIQFSVETDGVVSVCFAVPTTQDKTLAFSFSPADKEPYTSLFKLMAASMQTVE